LHPLLGIELHPTQALINKAYRHLELKSHIFREKSIKGIRDTDTSDNIYIYIYILSDMVGTADGVVSETHFHLHFISVKALTARKKTKGVFFRLLMSRYIVAQQLNICSRVPYKLS